MDGEPFVGMIQPFGFGFAPRSWATCSGQLMPIAQNTALFSLLGTTYGGDGRTTFALPDLRGRSMTGTGTGPGLIPVLWGQRGGSYYHILTNSTMPAHTHTGYGVAERAPASSSNPENNKLAGDAIYAAPGEGVTKNLVQGSVMTTNTGGQQPFYNREPYLGLYICIALFGVYPSRS